MADNDRMDSGAKARKRREAAKKAARTRAAEKHARKQWERLQNNTTEPERERIEAGAQALQLFTTGVTNAWREPYWMDRSRAVIEASGYPDEVERLRGLLREAWRARPIDYEGHLATRDLDERIRAALDDQEAR